MDEFTFQAMREYCRRYALRSTMMAAARLPRRPFPTVPSPRSRIVTWSLKNVATGDLDLATEDEKKEAEDATKEKRGPL